MALSLKEGAAEEKKVTTAKAKAAVDAQAPVEVPSAEANANLGVDADKLEFLGALVDPSQDDTIEKDGEKVTTGTIVGYKFKADMDLDVPNVLPGDDFKENKMSFTGDVTATVHVPAGTEFNLTKFETGVLISQERFDGRALKGDKKVGCTYNFAMKKNAAGGVDKAQAVPSIALKAIGAGQSIKDWTMFDVLSFTKEPIPGSTRMRKVRTLKEGYEKFAPLVKQSVRMGGKPASEKSQAATRNKNAEKFLQIVAARAKKA